MRNATIILFVLSMVNLAVAQEYEVIPEEIYRPPLNQFLNKFSLTVTTGYNSTNYKQDLNGYYLIQRNDSLFITENIGEFPSGQVDTYSNWFNNPTLVQSTVQTDSLFDVPFNPISNPVNNPLLQNDEAIYNADSLGLAYQGRGWGIPINIGIRYNYKKFRIGLGLGMEMHTIKSLRPNVQNLGLMDYKPNFTNAFLFSYYGQIGYQFYDFWDYSFAAELNIGKYNLGKHWSPSQVAESSLVNVGISIEKNLSEYFRIIVKPSYDIKSYKVAIPGVDQRISHSNNAFNVHVGVSITFPEIRRTPMASDHVQLKHLYYDDNAGRYEEVRGQPIWKVQNPKVGQNHRKLWRYKNANKNKINPY